MGTVKHSKNRKTVRSFWHVAFSLLVGSFLFACAEEQDPNNPNNNNPNNPPVAAKVEITGTSPEYVFWGEELTISGSGFSTKVEDNFVWIKQEVAALGTCLGESPTDSLGWRKATIVTATATSLKIKIPYKTAAQNDGRRPCGAITPRVSVTVGNSTAVSQAIKVIGLPFIREICVPNSGFKGAGIVPGMDKDNFVSIDGLGIYAKDLEIDKKLKLTVGMTTVPLQKREPSLTGCSGTFIFRLPAEVASGACTPDPIITGRFAKIEDLIVSIEGRDTQSESFKYPISSQPHLVAQSFSTQRFSWSKAGNPEIRIKGANVNWFTEARFLSTNGSCPMATIAPVAIGPEETVVGIPLATMKIGCTYQLVLRTNCGTSTGQLGSVIIDP